MRKMYSVVAPFEASHEERARQILREIEDLLRNQVEDEHFVRGEARLHAGLPNSTDRTVEASEASSAPLMALSCNDVFDIEPDIL